MSHVLLWQPSDCVHLIVMIVVLFSENKYDDDDDDVADECAIRVISV